MPIAVTVDELRPGMRLARPLRNRWTTLLTVGTAFSADRIDRLRRVTFDGPILIEDPLLDAKVEFDDQTRDQELAAKVHREMVGAVAEVERRFAKSTVLEPSDFFDLQQTLAEVVRNFEENPTRGAFLIKARSAGEYLNFHAANVFYLSMLIGRDLLYYMHRERLRQSAADRIHRPLDLTPLGQAALLHDVGMIPLRKICRKPGRLSADELAQIRTHPITGSKMIPEGFSPFVRTVILQHHENADGTGYPEGCRSGDTHVFSRIVRVADAFDAGTSTTLDREARPACRVLYEMTVGPCHHLYDPALTRVFATVIQPFAIGARLRLTTGQTVVVVRHTPGQPFAPVVIVAFDQNGRRMPPDELQPPIDLSVERNVRLHSHGREPLGYLYNKDAALLSHRSAIEARTLFELAYP